MMTDLHEPISNLLQTPESNLESARPIVPQLAEGASGGDGDTLDLGDDGRELLGTVTGTLESAAFTPPSTQLADIGAASFRHPEAVLETVHGPDNRVRVEQTASYPYRVSASLLITAGDGSQWIGTGWFISARTLITAGHCVYIKNAPVPGRDGWVKSIQVMPGRNGQKLPYGSVTSGEFWTVRGWSDRGDENYDYGAIILPTPMGERTGTLGFGNLPDTMLRGARANVTGYPGDKPAGELWYDSKAIASVSSGKVIYDIDTAGGQSGAAVYVVHQGRRLAVAVHSYGGPTTNSGTRISAPVFANFQAWKA